MNKNRGFTLVELMVAVGIMGILGVIFTNTLVQSMRGQSKVNVLDQVKQNGQVVMDHLTNDIRQAEYVVCPPSGTQSYLVVYDGNNYLRFKTVGASATSNGMLTEEKFTASDVSGPTDGYCTITLPASVPLTSLNDSDPKKGVSVNSASFIVSSQGAYQSVEIKMNVGAPAAAGGTYESQVPGGVNFDTTVALRGGG